MLLSLQKRLQPLSGLLVFQELPDVHQTIGVRLLSDLSRPLRPSTKKMPCSPPPDDSQKNTMFPLTKALRAPALLQTLFSKTPVSVTPEDHLKYRVTECP